jgi:hypothetical protein
VADFDPFFTAGFLVAHHGSTSHLSADRRLGDLQAVASVNSAAVDMASLPHTGFISLDVRPVVAVVDRMQLWGVEGKVVWRLPSDSRPW